MPRIKNISIKFYWPDLWWGVFFDTEKRAIYVCLIPMFPIKIELETK